MSFGVKSRREREQEQRKRMARGRRNLSQLVGTQGQGQRTPMNRGSGYVNTVQAPKFPQSNVGDDITQAGLAFKGGKGIHDFATGTEGGYNKAGVWVEGKEPWSLGDKTISERISQYGTDVSDRFSNAPRDLGNLFNPQPSPSELAQLEKANVGFGGDPIIPPSQANLNEGMRLTNMMNNPTTPSQLGKGAWKPVENNPYLPTGASNQLTDPMLAAQNATKAGQMSQLTAPGSFGGGGMGASSNLLSGAGAGSGLQGLGHLGSFGGGAEGIQGLGHLSLTGTGGFEGGFGGGSAPFGSSLNAGGTPTGSIQAGSSTADAASGLQGGGGQPWLAYANIGKDLIMGGPGSEKITGSTAGDAAIRAAAAYFTFGLSEIPYAFI
jgi:hypothetical protein